MSLRCSVLDGALGAGESDRVEVGLGAPAGEELPAGGEVPSDGLGVDGSGSGSVGSGSGSGSEGAESEGSGGSVGFGPGSSVGSVGSGLVLPPPPLSELRVGWLGDGVCTVVWRVPFSSVVITVVGVSDVAEIEPVTATPSITTVVSAGSA
ncbi:hypothetical protein SZMC14600_11123 [Saccharomonospora azurea SZMC 14600]|nr:hypothetical protein SZMC14600_11123 [Saccharomonospora azurea SZMC 14600]